MPTKKTTTKEAKVAPKVAPKPAPKKKAPKAEAVEPRKKLTTEQWILIGILLLLASPIIFGFLGGMLGLIVGLVGIVVALVAVAVAIICAPIGITIMAGLGAVRGDVPVHVWLFSLGMVLILVPIAVAMIGWLVKLIVGLVKVIPLGIQKLVNIVKGGEK